MKTKGQSIHIWEQMGITGVRISMAPPLRWVNSYILRGPEGITIIDPGPNTDEAAHEWEEIFVELNIKPTDISAMVITHHHPDHYGMAGYLQSITGAPVYMSPRAHEETLRMWGHGTNINIQLLSLYGKQGLPDPWFSELPAHLESFIGQVTPAPVVTYLGEGSSITMGERTWTVIESGGHAPGHLSFYNKEEQLIICGDAVLPQISPNVSYVPGSDPQPLRSFLNALERFKYYEVSLAFPGHRNPFDHFTDRLEALIKHHEERLGLIRTVIADRPTTGYEVCVKLFGAKLGIHQMRFAMSETLAHLIELVRIGNATIVERSGMQMYEAK